VTIADTDARAPRPGRALGAAAGGVALLLAGRALWRRLAAWDLRRRVVLITGGSRGLGLALAEAFAREGARLVICARDAADLAAARARLERMGAEVLALPCDVADRAAVERLVGEATRRFGRIDVLVNNAGQIAVGPLESQRLEDFEQAMAVMFWGVVYPTLAVLPQMRARGEGRVVNVTSIGGKVAVPHLVPYGCAKFAAVGFSEGLRAELARAGIAVVTVVPGLMRTGSYLNAGFKGRHRAEFTWFALGATSPLTTVGAGRAARQIVAATRRGDAEVVLSWQAKLLALVHGVAPGLTADLLGVVNRLLPPPGGVTGAPVPGKASETPVTASPLTALGRRAAARYNQ
jgi:NAD(P)-dependent dehydrogenase (short-subunit alcohol dehydrogenase family)